jgi:exodeoxyribonuclease V alpha subunit
MVKMTRIFRQSEDSVLVEFANTIRQGMVPQGYRDSRYRDFRFVDRSIPNYWAIKNALPAKELDAIKEKNIKEILDQIIAQAERAKPHISDPISDFQVLTPMKRHT